MDPSRWRLVRLPRGGLTPPAGASGHVDLDLVGDAAEDRVIAAGRLQDRAGNELRHRAVGGEARDEALPGDASADVAVEPEAAVARAEDLAPPDRVRLRRHPR